MLARVTFNPHRRTSRRVRTHNQYTGTVRFGSNLNTITTYRAAFKNKQFVEEIRRDTTVLIIIPTTRKRIIIVVVVVNVREVSAHVPTLPCMYIGTRERRMVVTSRPRSVYVENELF